MLIELLVVVLVLMLVCWLAQKWLQEPARSAAYAVCAVILVVWLLRFAGLISPRY